MRKHPSLYLRKSVPVEGPHAGDDSWTFFTTARLFPGEVDHLHRWGWRELETGVWSLDYADIPEPDTRCSFCGEMFHTPRSFGRPRRYCPHPVRAEYSECAESEKLIKRLDKFLVKAARFLSSEAQASLRARLWSITNNLNDGGNSKLPGARVRIRMDDETLAGLDAMGTSRGMAIKMLLARREAA